MEPLLKLSNLKKYFTGHKAVDDISFSIERGSIFGLLGPNGAGKTTLIRMITGIFFPDEGTISFSGKPFHPEKDPARIGYMPEERGLYKKMKVGEQVLYLAGLKGLSKKEAFERAKYWFEKLDMTQWWHKKTEDLSKGMGQKLQFVTTILHEPELVILDEPFSGLDPVNARLIKDEIFALAQKGTTIIFSTHRMEQVEEICDHIILVNRGKKILDGSVQEIRQQFKKNRYLLEAVPEWPLQLNPPFEVIEQSGHRWEIRKSAELSNNELIRHFMKEDKEILSFSEILPSLNDIFIELVNQQPNKETVTKEHA